MITQNRVQLLRHLPPWILFVGVILFLGLQMNRLILKSNGFDEIAYIGQGQYHLHHGDFSFSRFMHTPFPKYVSAFPLALNGVSLPEKQNQNPYYFGYQYIYENEENPLTLLLSSRLPMLIFPILLVIFLYKWIDRLADPWTSLGLSLFILFDPNIMAHSGLVMLDMGLTATLFISAYYLWRYETSKKDAHLLLSGFCYGLALLSKTTSLLVCPLYVLFLWSVGRDTKRYWPQRIMQCAKYFLISFVVVVVGYGFVGIPYWFYDVYDRFIQSVDSGHGVSSFGWHGIRQSADPFGYLAKVFLKFSIPFLVIFIWGVIVRLRRLNRSDLLIMGIPFIFLIPTLFSATQSAVRYILPMFPFVALWVASQAGTKSKLILAVLLSLQVLTSARAYPHYLPYTNLFYQPKGIPVFYGSEYDFGQDLPSLEKYANDHKATEIYLCYFGYASPQAYGLNPQLLPGYPALVQEHNPVLLSEEPTRELLVVSVSSLQGHKDRDLFTWVDQQPPIEKIGKTLWVWDITHDVAVHRQLKTWYQRYGWTAHVERENKRIESLMHENQL